MAEMIPLVRHDEGYPANVAAGDTVVAPRFKGTGVAGIAFDANGTRIVGLGVPLNQDDAASKEYVDQKVLGFHAKSPVRVATTGNVNLSAAPSVIDGVTLASGDRVLVKDQTNATQNGIYVYEDGALKRAPDADQDGELMDGNTVWVNEGGQEGSLFQLTTNNPIIIGTTPITWEKFSGIADLVVSTGLTRSGNTISADIGLGASQVAAGNHTHTVTAGNGLTGGGSLVNGGSVSLAVGAGNGITVGATSVSVKPDTSNGIAVGTNGVRINHGQGLKFSNGAIVPDFGPGAGQVAEGNHTHSAADVGALPDTTDLLAGNGLKATGTLASGQMRLEVKEGSTNTIAAGSDGVDVRYDPMQGLSHGPAGLTVALGKGFQFDDNGKISLRTGDGLGLDAAGDRFEVKTGDGIGIDGSGNLTLRVWGSLVFDPSGNLMIHHDDESLTTEIGQTSALAAQAIFTKMEAMERITVGDVVAMDPTTGGAVRASAAGNGRVIGIAHNTVGTGETVKICTHGVSWKQGGMSAGDTIFLGTSPGSISKTPPASGRQVRLGFVSQGHFHINVADWGVK